MLTSFFIKNNKLFFYKIFFIKQTYLMDEEHSTTHSPKRYPYFIVWALAPR